MTAHFFMRLVLLASGLLLTTAFVVQSGTLGKIPPAWTVTGTQPAARPAECGHGGTAKPSAASHVVAEGRVVAYPGAEVVVGTEAAGRIVHLEIQEKSVVRKGDLIAELNAEDLKADHALASARIMEAEADIRFFDREFRRDTALIARNAGTPQNLDVNRRGLDAARARRAAALAERDRIAALFAKTRIIAPINGVVTTRHVHPGETVEVAAKIITIADLNRIRIEAEVDEFDTSRVALGADVLITAEGFPARPGTERLKRSPTLSLPVVFVPKIPGARSTPAFSRSRSYSANPRL